MQGSGCVQRVSRSKELIRKIVLRSHKTIAMTVGLAAVLITLSSSRADNAPRASVTSLQSGYRPSRFVHEKKEHQKIDCASCHAGANTKPARYDRSATSGGPRSARTDQPMARDFPHSDCVRCHNFAAEFFKTLFGKPSGFCSVCHENRRISKADTALWSGPLTRGDQSDFGDIFSHNSHRKALAPEQRVVPVTAGPNAGYGTQFRSAMAARCTDCHLAIQKPARDEKDMRTEKSHPTCFVCHGGAAPEPRRVPASQFPYETDCAACHGLRATGQASPAAPLFGSIKDFRHNDHDIDITPKKRSDFPLPTAPDYMCDQCHRPAGASEKLSDIRLPGASYCTRCHIDDRPGLPSKLSNEVLMKLTRQ